MQRIRVLRGYHHLGITAHPQTLKETVGLLNFSLVAEPDFGVSQNLGYSRRGSGAEGGAPSSLGAYVRVMP